MPSKTIKKQGAVTLPSIPKELIDQMVSGPMDAEAVNASPQESVPAFWPTSVITFSSTTRTPATAASGG